MGDGVYVHGLYVEGAHWDVQRGALAVPKGLREYHERMPVVLLKAVHRNDAPHVARPNDYVACPVYPTLARRRRPPFTAHLRSTEPASKWVLSSLCLILDKSE